MPARRSSAVPDAHRGDGLGDLLAVGADVLDRGRADAARDAGQRLDADPAALDGARPRTRPSGSPAATVTTRAAAGGSSLLDVDAAGVATSTTVPAKPVVGDDQVAAAGEHEHGLAGLVGAGVRRRRSSSSVVARAPARGAGPPSRSVVWSASR